MIFITKPTEFVCSMPGNPIRLDAAFFRRRLDSRTAGRAGRRWRQLGQPRATYRLPKRVSDRNYSAVFGTLSQHLSHSHVGRPTRTRCSGLLLGRGDIPFPSWSFWHISNMCSSNCKKKKKKRIYLRLTAHFTGSINLISLRWLKSTTSNVFWLDLGFVLYHANSKYNIRY